MTDLSILDTVAAAPAAPAPVSSSEVAGQVTFNVLSGSALRKAESVRVTEAFTTLLDGALVQTRRAEYAAGRGSGEGDVAKKRIGAGYIGVECDRVLGFRFHKFPKEDRPSFVSPGALQRHAESGYWTEDQMATWFRMAGFGLETFERNPDGSPVLKDDGTYKQIGWKALPNNYGQAQVAGEVDGVFTHIPAVDQIPEEFRPALSTIIGILEAPFLWESKKATAKKVKTFEKDGVRKSDPKYFGQMQINMNIMQIPATLFTMLCLDDMRFYFEIVRMDPDYVGKIMDRAIKVVRSQSPFDFSPISTNPEHKVCRYCDFRETCYAGKQ
jgi:hypothetical protein